MQSPRCPVCDLALRPGRDCPNYWCGRTDRGFDVVWSIGAHTGELRRAIAGLKYRGERQWLPGLGRMLAGYLLEHSPWFEDIELIVAIPGAHEADRPLDHMR